MKRIFPLICFLLGAVFAISPTAYALAEPTNGYDYSYPQDAFTENETLSASELLELLNHPLSDLEKSYLSANSNTTFSYYSKIPSSSPSIKANLSETSLYLEAQPYSYQGANGQTVTWLPYSAEGNTFTHTNSAYTVSLTNIPQTRDYAELTYTANFTISNQQVNTLLNQTYYAAKAYADEYDEQTALYQQAYANYVAQQNAYQTYQAELAQYQLDCQAYATYQSELASWKQAKEAYDKYVEAQKVYEEQLAAYQKYKTEQLEPYQAALAEYNNYINALEEYKKAKEAYYASEDYNNLLKAQRQLSILSFLTTPVTSLNRVLQYSILGDTVTSVTKEKDTLVNDLKADKTAVELADSATTVLRSLITSYNACQTEEAQYQFYVANYDSLVTNFEELLRALEYLYTNNSVRLAIEQQGKKSEYLILIAQLFVISNALDDKPIGNYQSAHKAYDKTHIKTYDENWTIDGKTPLELLENVVYLEDTNDATPLANGYPVVGEEPTEPQEVQKPTAPASMKEPIAPTIVENPGEAPAEVLKPTEPTAVEAPDKEPQPFVPSEEAKPLIEAYKNGELAYRTLYESDITFSLTAQVRKQFRNVQDIELYFYDTDGTFLWETTAEKHSNVAYQGVIPTKERTGYTCTFDYWQDENGNKVDLHNFSIDQSDIYLYPHFTETPNLYAVNWVIDGTTQTTYVAYQQMPSYPNGTPTKANDGMRQFRFTGWDNAFVAVEGEQTYVAQFEASYLITFETEQEVTTQSLWAGEMPTLPQTPQKADDSYYGYTFSGWNPEVTEAQADAHYVAQFTRYALIPQNDEQAPLAVTTTAQDYVIDATTQNITTLSVSLVLQRAQTAQKGLQCLFTNATLLFDKTAVSTLSENAIEEIALSVEQSRSDSYTYVVWFNGKTRATLADCAFTFIASGEFNEEYIHLYQQTADESTQEVRFELAENTITFTALPNTTYTLLTQYTVHVVNSPNVTLSVNQALCQSGESITVTYSNLSAGMELKNIVITDSEGNAIPLEDGTFIMPQNEVTITAVCAYLQFTISFSVNGRVISSKVYQYGDSVQVPTDPVLADDETYSYTFVGWSDGETTIISKEVPTVVEETNYVAVFESELLPPKEEAGWTKLKIIVTAIKVGIVIFFILFVIITILLIRRHRKKVTVGGRSHRRNRTR